MGGIIYLLSFLDGVAEGGRLELGVRSPGPKGLHFGRSAVSNILGEVARDMGRAVGVELGELVDELSKELLAGALEAADAARVSNLSSAEPP